MSDYIKREDALDIVAHNNVHGEITLNRYDKIIDGIYEIPPADVAPVRHGRWITKDGIIDCSVCNDAGWSVVPYETLVKHFNYCPNCGAKMDGEEE